MAFNKQRIIIISVLFSLTACTGGGSDDPNPTPQPPLAEKRPIHISPTLQSRATESNFEIGDYIGLYIVNHPSNGRALKKVPVFGKTNKKAASYCTSEQFSDGQILNLFCLTQ